MSLLQAMNRELLEHRLRQAFDGEEGEYRVVVRMAGDLSDSGRYRRDTDHPLSPQRVVSHLQDAPGGTVADRWNWWMGALDSAFGGYSSFHVVAWDD
ncbi:MAG: hypothetical protein ABEJ58_03765 [Halodesulfurarchaeum sp.]